MTCKACHHDHPPMQTCGTAARLRLAQGLVDHARTVAMVPAINSPAINTKAINTVAINKSKNRRTRETYNAYMREYMSKARAKKKEQK